MTGWLFDLGNTRLKCAPLGPRWRAGDAIALPHRAGDVAAALDSALPPRIDTAYLASVASPELTATVLSVLQSRSGQVRIARTLAHCAGVRVAYEDPRGLGVDRFLALLAVHQSAAGPALVCGVGTALTIDLLDADGTHLGGRIAPSPALMREALHGRAAQLPLDGGCYQEFAANTLDALASGCDGAAAALIERSLDAARRRLDIAPSLHLHGGGARPLMPLLGVATWSERLVLDGLALWAREQAAIP